MDSISYDESQCHTLKTLPTGYPCSDDTPACLARASEPIPDTAAESWFACGECCLPLGHFPHERCEVGL